MAHRRVRLKQSEWDVWDVRPETRALRMGTDLENGWLCFQSGASRRRLFPIPPDWDALEPDELEELLDRATPVQPATEPVRHDDRAIDIRGARGLGPGAD